MAEVSVGDGPDAEDQFTLTEGSVLELQLKLRNATRWNSTYLIINRAWKLQSGIQAYMAKVDLTNAPSQGLPQPDRLTTEDWRSLFEPTD